MSDHASGTKNQYEIPTPEEQLGQALAILEGVKCPDYGDQLNEAVELITSAKAWYDSTILREEP
jgi:hypothetical protein